MKSIQFDIPYLSYQDVTDQRTLYEKIYPEMRTDYYWSDDFSPEYYIAQAKAGLIATTECHEGEELLLPEMLFGYALLDFKDLHISRKVKKLLAEKKLQLEVSQNLNEVFEGLGRRHRHNWLIPRYLETLKATQGLDENFYTMSVFIREDGEVVAGEIGYALGKTYTSLSGFVSREKRYRNYGTAQLVLLARHLEENGFAFWNLGQPYMAYKFALGARIHERKEFLERWSCHQE
jgi:Leu/Phe-tRNA-protein transferase